MDPSTARQIAYSAGLVYTEGDQGRTDEGIILDLRGLELARWLVPDNGKFPTLKEITDSLRG